MAIPVHALGSLMARFTNKVVNEQAELSAPLLKGKVLNKLKKSGEVGVVNVKAGEVSSIKFVADGGALAVGSDILPVQGTYLPVAMTGRLKIPRLAANQCQTTDDGIDLVMEQLDTLGNAMGRQLNRAIYGNSLGSPAATVSVGASTFTIASAAGFRVGMAFEVYNGSSAIEGTSEATLLTVTRIQRPVDGIGNSTITFTAAGGAGNISQWETTHTIHLRGAKSTNATMVSLSDVFSTSAALYGIAATTQEWSGNSDSTGVALTVGQLRSWLSAIVTRRGEMPTHILLNRKNIERYGNQMINQRRFVSGTMDAVGSQVPEFEGIPLFQDENLQDAELIFFNNKDVKLHEFKALGADFDGGSSASKGMSRSALMLSDSEFVYDMQVWGAYNVRAERRNGGGVYAING